VEILLSAAAAIAPAPGPPVGVDAPPVSPAPDPQPRVASSVVPFAWRDLVEPDWWACVPADVAELLALLPTADLYVQDEVDVRLHPTLTRLWSRKGKAGQRHIPAPGQNARFVAAGAADWRDGWLSVGFALGRTAALVSGQLDHLVARSQQRGRTAIVVLDNARVHTPRGARLIRDAVARHGDKLRLVYTPAYDPDANPTERLWRPMRRRLTHNHHRHDLLDLYTDAERYFEALDADPDTVLRHIGSPHAATQSRATEPIPPARPLSRIDRPYAATQSSHHKAA
jgi:transposase